MPKTIPLEVKALIKYLSEKNMSSRMIQKEIEKENFVISQKSICNIINNNHLEGLIVEENSKNKPRSNKRPVRTPALVSKVRRLAAQKNPPSQRDMAKMFGASAKTINTIIHKDLGLETRRKTPVHALSTSHKANRKTNCRKLYERYLAGGKYKYFVTLDEAWLYVNYCNGERKIYYHKPGQETDDDWKKKEGKSWPEKIMVVAAVTGKGCIPLFKVPNNVKINSEYYISNVLDPIFNIYLPKLYKNEMHLITFHHDMASSHTSKKTCLFLAQMKAKYGITYLANKDIPVKSPDAAICDFFAFGFIKQTLLKRRAVTMEGIWKLAVTIWNTITPADLEPVFASLKRRCRLIAKSSGNHIEQTKRIHHRKIM